MTLRSQMIQVRVTEAEKEEAKRNAELAGVDSLSEYARAKILGGDTKPEKGKEEKVAEAVGRKVVIDDQLRKLTAVYARRMSEPSAKRKAEEELGLR